MYEYVPTPSLFLVILFALWVMKIVLCEGLTRVRRENGLLRGRSLARSSRALI